MPDHIGRTSVKHMTRSLIRGGTASRAADGWAMSTDMTVWAGQALRSGINP